jgi:hypothetical protein
MGFSFATDVISEAFRRLVVVERSPVVLGRTKAQILLGRAILSRRLGG